MPEMQVHLRWPDGSAQHVYSPSLVVTEHVAAGHSYPIDDLVRRMRVALGEASARVQASYGFPCSRAAASLAAVESNAERFTDGTVTVERFER